MTDHTELLADIDFLSCGRDLQIGQIASLAASALRAEIAARQAAEERAEQAEAHMAMLQRQPKDLLPHGCTGMAFMFDPGVLRISKDGSGCLVVPEANFVLEDDRYAGPDGAEGSVHWLVHISADEMVGLRSFLTPGMDHATAAAAYDARIRAEAMEEAAGLPFPKDWRERSGGRLSQQKIWSDGFNACRRTIRAAAKGLSDATA